MTEMFGEAWSPMSVPDLAPDDDDDELGIRSELFFRWTRIFRFIGKPRRPSINEKIANEFIRI